MQSKTGQLAASSPEVDQVKLQALLQQVREHQNLALGIIAGAAAAGIAAVIWAIIVAVTKYEIGYMGIGAGALVGIAVRYFGKGMDKSFGVAGALLALVGCLLGNILTVVVLVSQEPDMIPFIDILLQVMTSPVVIIDILTTDVSYVTVLIYGLALFTGYRLSFRQLTETEAASVIRPAAPTL